MNRKREFYRPRIFISHASQDKPLADQLMIKMQSAGMRVWVDHNEILGGDNLPLRISNALMNCNILLLLWSKAARKSHWVKLEWTSALSLNKKIIPCLLDRTTLPAILTSTVHIKFINIDLGIVQLFNELNLAKSTIPVA